MVFIILTGTMSLVCWKSGRWKNWKEYYPTILYLFIGDIVSLVLLYYNPLWALCELTYKYRFVNIAIMAVLYPGLVIVYLSYYPIGKLKQMIYVILWVALFSGLEYFAYRIGDFLYFNGWNILYSIIFYVGMFIMVRLHYKKPLLAWPISTVLAFALIWLFKIPLQSN